MKNWWIKLLLLSFIVLISIHFLIPAKIDFREVIIIKVNQTVAGRFISDENKWGNWWPGKNKQDNNGDAKYHHNNNFSYTVNQKLTHGDSVIIKRKSILIKSLLNIIPINNDSVAVQWRGQSESEINPVTRLKNYLESLKNESSIEELLQSMKVFLEKKENVYGHSIDQIQVKDTILVAKRFTSNSYPTINEVYKLINNVRDYIYKAGAKETNYPMLHVIQDNFQFNTMVAIPVNKSINPNNEFLLKKMVPGKILVTEVRGGIHTINQAQKNIELYMNDHHLVAPAIPFHSLVTDRSTVADTTKWITKIYYPVM